MRYLIILLALASQLLWAQAAPNPNQSVKKQLLVLVSQRNADTIAAAARDFSGRHPGLVVVARSDTQLWEMTPEALRQLLADSDMVLGLGLFGASVGLLERELPRTGAGVLMINSDNRLVRLSRLQGRPLFRDDEQVRTIAGQPSKDFDHPLDELVRQYPAQAEWISARRYWQAGGNANSARLFAWAHHALGAAISVEPPEAQPRLRWLYRGQVSTALPAIPGDAPLIAVLDHTEGDRPADDALYTHLCERARQAHNSECLVGLAYWGAASAEAVRELTHLKQRLSAVVMLQDFIIGGGEGREAVTADLKALNVPVLKAVKLRDRSQLERHLSSDGLPGDNVYYQIAMPELQGASQPLIVATAGEPRVDPLTGIRIQPLAPDIGGIATLLARAARWRHLKTTANRDKHIAIVYYNHPPGRHNIGADNLDVPASLWQILHALKAAGYDTGELPASQDALLDQMQARGINLPNDAQALKDMAPGITRIPVASYRVWFDTLPASVRRELNDGPFGLLHEQLRAAVTAAKPALAVNALEHTSAEMRHLLEGVDHPGRQRALALLDQLESCYRQALKPDAEPCWDRALTIITALQQTGIEGLGGWGEPPGKVMTLNGELLLPGLRFGNIFIGPQPPRGWEINEELLHANLAFPPPHQYLAFYHYLRDDFRADAIVHLGRHSTYEFLPRRAVGLGSDDYSRIVAADIPGVYPYIVDGVGEGIQAKRRGLAVMVDHLTPPLKSTPLYDDLLKLRQLVESFEASGRGNPALAQRLVQQIRDKVNTLELKEELAESMAAELAVMGIGFDEVDDEMLVHEVGHYLTNLQERFMPLGLHIFGKPWKPEAVAMMLDSMAPENKGQRSQWQSLLTESPKAEMAALLRGLDGGYIAPGPGNDPIRSPGSLPTGRNFYALDNSLIPSPAAWDLGRDMARNARANNAQNPDKREALVLWASDVVRDEGVMIAFGLDMLGLKPQWNSRGLLMGLERQTLDKDHVRRDVVFTTSGLFRDLYARQMALLDQAALMALDASADTIVRDHPALTLALGEALKPLKHQARGGSESLAQNQVAAHWVKQARQLLDAGQSAEQAGALASLRVFGDAPGSYGAGVNRLAERSGAWHQRQELADVYLRRLGHGYGAGGFGTPVEDVFRTVLADVENTYLGRSSNLYGLIDNNDAFDYLGGLSLAVETLTGAPPNNYVLNHADATRVTAEPLGLVLRQELRGRFLNPEWLKGLQGHGYAGARTMGSEFLEYLWGWQVTNPTLVGDWAWQEVKEVYMDDRYGLGLDTFLEEGHNVHVKSNMLGIMLVAVHKGFWNADDATRKQLAGEFARLVAVHGLPGSGHTSPNHPMLPWLEQYLPAAQWQALKAVIDKARATPETTPETHRLSEIELQQQPDQVQDDQEPSKNQGVEQTRDDAQTADSGSPAVSWLWLLPILLVMVVVAGYVRALAQTRPKQLQLQPLPQPKRGTTP